MVVSLAEPPSPVQVSVKVLSLVIAALVAVPLVARAPLHAPLALQLEASVLLQLKVAV